MRTSQHTTAPGDAGGQAPTRRFSRRPDEDDPTRAIPASSPDAASGAMVLERYVLEQRLGAGGFGVVWRARDVKLERYVAVKVIPRDENSAEDERVGREALAAARLNHPGIVALYELAADDAHHYLVSELVDGATLASLTRGSAVSDRDVARIGHALCEALEHAHQRGVIHRDVKPQNVMVLAEPAAGAGFAKLTDFGIAHLASADGVTATGDVLGTLAYMAPEQAEGIGVTGATDVYSLALTLYEAWTGSNPVRGATPAATARRVGSELPSLGSRRRDLPPELCEVIDAALEADPDLRPMPAELGEVLGGAADELDEQGGLVEPANRERFGLVTAGRSRRARARRDGLIADEPRPRRGLALAGRVGNGVAAGLLAAAALALGPTPPAEPALLALGAGAAVALLPRIGWLASAAALVIWLGSPSADRAGVALILAAGLLPVPVLLWRAPVLWSLPALAPVLGLAGLAPAFAGVAALAPRLWRRAAVAALGVWWLVLGEETTGKALLSGLPAGAQARGAWETAASAAADTALIPALTSSQLAQAPIWAVFAVLFGLLVRGRFPALDLVLAAAWAAGLAAVLVLAGGALAPAIELDVPRGAIPGALVGGLVAVVVTLRTRGAADDPSGTALP